MSRALVINTRVIIPAKELAVSFVRSSGPGGQNVNKVNSKAVLRWDLRSSDALSDGAKRRFESYFPTRVNQAGEVILASDTYRDQGRNLADCYTRLRQLILAALEVPKTRKKTRPTRGSVENRLADKRRRSQLKQQRRGPSADPQ